jgi:uncharacterized OB-fold protein
LTPRRSQPAVYAMARTKKAMIATMQAISAITFASPDTCSTGMRVCPNP